MQCMLCDRQLWTEVIVSCACILSSELTPCFIPWLTCLSDTSKHSLYWVIVSGKIIYDQFFCTEFSWLTVFISPASLCSVTMLLFIIYFRILLKSAHSQLDMQSCSTIVLKKKICEVRKLREWKEFTDKFVAWLTS